MKTFNSKRCILLATLALFFLGARTETFAQFGRIKEKVGELGKKAPVSSLLEGEPPITTSLSDAVYGDTSRDGYNPNELTPLTSLVNAFWRCPSERHAIQGRREPPY